MHKGYVSKYPDNSEMRGNKAKNLKRNLRSRQAIFPKPIPINKAKMATTASYGITQILAKKKPFEDGSVMKQCLDVAGGSLHNSFKNKDKCTVQLMSSSYLEVSSIVAAQSKA
jgi:hypothetical protein